MRALFILTPCRLSFALCAALALLTDLEHASHITIADPPSFRRADPDTIH